MTAADEDNPLLKHVETTEASEKMTEALNAIIGPKCFKCSHYRICGIFLAVYPLVENYPIGKDKSPIRAEDLAKICLDYEEKLLEVQREEE